MNKNISLMFRFLFLFLLVIDNSANDEIDPYEFVCDAEDDQSYEAETEDNVEEPTEPGEINDSQKPKRSSPVWNHLKITNRGEKKMTVCNHCKKEYVYNYSTKNMHQHLISVSHFDFQVTSVCI